MYDILDEIFNPAGWTTPIIKLEPVLDESFMGSDWEDGDKHTIRVSDGKWNDEEKVFNACKELINEHFLKRTEVMVLTLSSDRAPKFYLFEPILHDLVAEFGKKIIIIYNDAKKYDTQIKHIFSPQMWGSSIERHYHKLLEDRKGHEATFNAMEVDNVKRIKNNKRKKLFLSQNFQSRPHKRQWINFIKKHNLQQSGYVSIGWEKIFIEDYFKEFSWSKVYSDVLCEVTPETMMGYYNNSERAWSLQEKIWKPFKYKVIPMMIVYENTDEYLRDMGFDLFDDVLDTSFYKEPISDKKFEIIRKNLEIISNELSFNGRFNDDIWLRLEKNQEHFLDKENIKRYLLGKI